MNEIEIIQQQLHAERQHFADVVSAAAQAAAGGGELMQACVDYLAFALRRVEGESGSVALRKLESTRMGEPPAGATHWRELLQWLSAQWHDRNACLDAVLAGSSQISQWRAVARIDADSILEERELFSRVQASLRRGASLDHTAPVPAHD